MVIDEIYKYYFRRLLNFYRKIKEETKKVLGFWIRIDDFGEMEGGILLQLKNKAYAYLTSVGDYYMMTKERTDRIIYKDRKNPEQIEPDVKWMNDDELLEFIV